jgi:uncharacterized protein YkwD
MVKRWLFCGLFIAVVLSPLPAFAERGNSPEALTKIFQEVNARRKAHSLPALQWEAKFNPIAAGHNNAMAQGKRAFSHDKFEERFNGMRDVNPQVVTGAENVAKFTNVDNFAVRVVDGWMKSKVHRENILGNFTHTGLAIATGKDRLIYITQIFAKVDPAYNPSAPKRPTTVEELQDYLR